MIFLSIRLWLFISLCPPVKEGQRNCPNIPPPLRTPLVETLIIVKYIRLVKKKLKGEGNFPSYFDNDDVMLHIFTKFRIWYWQKRNIVVRKNQLFLYCYTKLSLSRRTRNQYLSSWNNLLNNFLSGLMFQYSFLLKSITCINYLIA